MAVRQLRTYLRRQKGARSLPRLRASPELFPGQSGKLLIKANNTLTYLISCSVGCFQPTEIFYAPPRFYSPHFFLSFCSDFVFIPCASSLSFRRLSVSTPKDSFLGLSLFCFYSSNFLSIVLPRSFFTPYSFPSNTFHRRTLVPFLLPSSPVSIPSPSPPRKNFEKRSLKTIFLNDKALVNK